MTNLQPRWGCYFVLPFLLVFATSRADAVSNPDLSVIGQMRVFATDDPDDPNRERAQLSFDESEIVAEAYLNPYARGSFVFAVAEVGLEVEEGYFQIVRGLPRGLALKGGKYRVGFGRLNPVHPHAYPFVERFRMLAEYLPGEESFNETGLQVSYQCAFPGDIPVTLAGDVLRGASFHPDEEESRPAALGRLSGFLALNDLSVLEIGVSATHGVNSVANRTVTTLGGVDFKSKWWFSTQNFLVLQGEFVALRREEVRTEDSTTTDHTLERRGAYLFANHTYRNRYNAGGKFEQYERIASDERGSIQTDRSIGLFVGLALMEETTLFRVNWDRCLPEEGSAFSTFSLQIVFSMGPHKPHQF